MSGVEEELRWIRIRFSSEVESESGAVVWVVVMGRGYGVLVFAVAVLMHQKEHLLLPP